MQNINHDAWCNFGDKSGPCQPSIMLMPRGERIVEIVSFDLDINEIALCNLSCVGLVDIFIENMIEMATK